MHGGFLDPFISGFHNAFSLPNRIRGAEQTTYSATTGACRMPRSSSEKKVRGSRRSDATGEKSHHLERAGATELAARAAIKLPTGSRDSLVSSGGTDLGFGVELSRVGRKVGGFFNLSYHVTSDLDEVRSKNFFSWMAAVDWRFKPTLSAVLQYDQFQPLLESDIKVLSSKRPPGCIRAAVADDPIAFTSSGALPKTSRRPLPISPWASQVTHHWERKRGETPDPPEAVEPATPDTNLFALEKRGGQERDS